MNFQDLHELLRTELLRRIDLGILTGTKLAEQAGFRQAHISNFLNAKRSLSLDGLDRVLAAQSITVDQLLPIDLNATAGIRQNDSIEVVPVVSASDAMEAAFISATSVIETVQVSASRLYGNRSRPVPNQSHWQRFLAVRADEQQSSAMKPIFLGDTIAVLDRHYNSLSAYRSHQPTLFAVRSRGSLVIRFVDFDEGRMILRPYSQTFPVQLLAMGDGKLPADYIVGRVCMLLSEL